MESVLKKQIEEFYDEMQKENSTEIGEIACDLVPRLIYKIEELEEKDRWYR